MKTKEIKKWKREVAANGKKQGIGRNYCSIWKRQPGLPMQKSKNYSKPGGRNNHRHSLYFRMQKSAADCRYPLPGPGAALRCRKYTIT